MLLKLINRAIVDDLAGSSQNSSRLRSSLMFHEDAADHLQRMVTVAQPGSYVRPHKHQDPDKVEVFVVLRGKLLVVTFAEDGTLSEHVVLGADSGTWGVEVPPATWHMTIPLEPDTAYFEVVEGPWEEHTHKKFPAWAPAEIEADAGQAFVSRIRQELMEY